MLYEEVKEFLNNLLNISILTFSAKSSQNPIAYDLRFFQFLPKTMCLFISPVRRKFTCYFVSFQKPCMRWKQKIVIPCWVFIKHIIPLWKISNEASGKKFLNRIFQAVFGIEKKVWWYSSLRRFRSRFENDNFDA